MTRSLGWLAMFLAIPVPAPAQEIFISEFLAANDTGLKDAGIMDADGEPADWIELWNAGATPVDLAGWHLTDNAALLSKWTLPSVTLAGGEYLVVFASGKDRREPGAELHTNFKLTAEGEYLALVRPDGAIVAHEYAPIFPPQRNDVSYGLGESGVATQLIALGSPARFTVPVSGNDGLGWVSPVFDDTSWAAASLGVGYEESQGGPPSDENLALNAPATQSSEYGGFPAGLAVDGNLGNFTATAANDPSPTWEVDLGVAFPLARLVIRNRGDGCCQSRLRDITVSVIDAEGDVAFESALLNAENVLGGRSTAGPAELTIDLLTLAGGAVPGRHVRVARTPDPDNSGTGGTGGADEAYVLSLGEVEVFASGSHLGAWIRTDVGAALRGVNSSGYLRVPFEVVAPVAFESLRLSLRFDDGAVVYLNGTEVARRNAPGAPGGPGAPLEAPPWNATATAERVGETAAVAETIDLSAQLGLLQPGHNVLAIHGLNWSVSDSDFLLAPELEARASSVRAPRYFERPTPGAANDPGGVIDFVADTKLSHDRGFYEEAFQLEITCATPGAEIRYTLDRSPPTATTGLVYNAPIPIASTTVVRAAAFKPGFAPTNVDTHTYLFLDDVVLQSVMLKDMVTHAVYGPELKPSLTAVPAVSLVTRATINAATEVGVSVELIHPDGARGFQIDAGVKKVGGHSLTAYPKNNMRLYFRQLYGQGKLKYPLFKGLPYGDRAVEEFDRLNLRSGSHDSVFYLGDQQQSPADAQYLRNRWMNDLQFAMGHPSINGRFVQLYINGTYWGFYDLMEWSSQEYLSAYFGGEDADYAATNSGRPVGNSNLAAWNKIIGLTNNYPELQRYLDVINFADYLVLNFYGGNAWDWNPSQNWMAGGPIAPDRGGFKLFCWDSDIVLRRTNDYNLDRPGPSNLFASLKTNAEFRVLLGDRAHRHLQNGGLLTPAAVTTSYTQRVEEIRSSLVAETARWRWAGRTWTRDNQWQKEVTRLLTDFIPRRTGILLDQLKQQSLYPRLEAPRLSQHGGLVPAGFELGIGVLEGTVYYTLDGSDPRLVGGALHPLAQEQGAATAVQILASGAPVKALVPVDESLVSRWTAIDFDDSSWRVGTTGVGFEKAAGFEGVIGTDVGADMYEKNGSVYLRLAFDVVEPAAWRSLTLRMKYDDGFVAHLNGERVAAANAPVVPSWNSNATASHADNLALVFQDFELPDGPSRLRQGRNVLAIQGLNLNPTSNDFLILPELVGSLAGGGGIRIDAPTLVKARTLNGGQWSALSEAFFWQDIPLRVTEIHYHPRASDPPGAFAADEFEFLELQNFGAQELELDGVRLAGGVTFEFASGLVHRLRPGEVVLVVENAVAFHERHGVAGLLIAGEYAGKLGNDGDFLRLEGSEGQVILDFRFQDDWYPRTDGDGRSLVLARADASASAWGDAANWTESAELDGSPGRVEVRPQAQGLQLPGDTTQDGQLDLSDAIALLGHLFLGRPSALPCGDGTTLDPANQSLLDSTGDGAIDLTDPIRVLNYLFLSGLPPVLGTECRPLGGCPRACGE